MPADRPAVPWLSFLTALDAGLKEPIDFHRVGGSVISQHYGFTSETADLDVLNWVSVVMRSGIRSLSFTRGASTLLCRAWWAIACWRQATV